MKTFWLNLKERERWALLLCLIICMFYTVFVLIYSPLVTALKNREQELYEKKKTLLWMQSLSGHGGELTKKNKDKFLNIIATQLKHSNFQNFPYQLQQINSADISLAFEKVPYQPFINWLWKLDKQFAISFKQCLIDRTETPGIIKISLVFV